MGAIISLIHKLQKQNSQLENRLSLLEKDVINNRIVTTTLNHKVESINHHVDSNTSQLLNISLLEEGRSVYRPKSRTSHTASSYR